MSTKLRGRQNENPEITDTMQPPSAMVWRAMAEQWVTELPHDYPFTADDLVLEVGLPTELDPKLSNNMVGSIMRHWRHTGQIVKTGYTMSDRRSNHGRVLATWEAYE